MRTAQEVLSAAMPDAVGANGGLKVEGVAGGVAVPVSGTFGGAMTIADGADVAEGTTTNAAASSTVAEDATARTGIGLWKGIKNILILLNAKFAAGTVIGNVAIDQTTPGTTNKVVASVASGGIASGAIASGAVASGAIASGAVAAGAIAAGAIVDGADLTQGAIADAAVDGDAAGTVNAHLRGISKKLAGTIAITGGGGGAMTVADGADVTEGAIADAAVDGDVAGSVNAHLRGISKKIAASVAVTGTFYPGTQPVSVASAQIVSGAIASGAVAAGAVSAGAVVSGAVLSGALATGAIVDLPVKGQAAMAASVPVAIANNQTAVPMSVASGGIASGGIASGAIASGAVASGAIASGAVASGAIAAGAVAAGAVVSGAVLSGALATGAIVDLPVKGQAAMAASVPVAIANNQTSVPVKGNDFSVQVDFTVDAGAYAIGDALAAMGTFAGMASAAGKHAIINSIVLAPNDAMPAIPFNLWLLNADLATPIAKNAAFTIVAADALKILGIIPITAADYIPSQNSWNVASMGGVGREYATVATSVYAYLVCTATTAPVATHVYLTLTGEWRD